MGISIITTNGATTGDFPMIPDNFSRFWDSLFPPLKKCLFKRPFFLRGAIWGNPFGTCELSMTSQTWGSEETHFQKNSRSDKPHSSVRETQQPFWSVVCSFAPQTERQVFFKRPRRRMQKHAFFALFRVTIKKHT